MRYLSKLLLTTTFLTLTTTYGIFIETDDFTIQPVATALPTSTISIAALNKINDLKTLVTHTSDFNISDASEIFFTPELYPFISWRSATRDAVVIDEVKTILTPLLNKGSKGLLLLKVLDSISFEDSLEKIKYSNPTPPVANPTMLTEIVDGTLCSGHYTNVLTNYDATFRPLLRLKIYLELLQQTNISSDNLGYVLQATTELAKMFMTAPSTAFVDTATKLKESLIASSPSTAEEPYFYTNFRYPSLVKIRTQTATPEATLQALTWASKELSRTLSQFESVLDTSVTEPNKTIDQILLSFEPDVLTLFRDVFEGIATHKNKTRRQGKGH